MSAMDSFEFPEIANPEISGEKSYNGLCSCALLWQIHYANASKKNFPSIYKTPKVPYKMFNRPNGEGDSSDRL